MSPIVYACVCVCHSLCMQWSKVGPLRILSFDIECQGKKGQFPMPEEDPVIQIANWVTIQGSDTPCVKNIFTLKSCAPISGAEVHSFESERDMLQAWRDFIIASDPDIITGLLLMSQYPARSLLGSCTHAPHPDIPHSIFDSSRSATLLYS